MINVNFFYKKLLDNDISFFTGVPDSLLADFCGFVSDHVDSNSHVIAANEGNALSIGIGYNLVTNKIPLIYLQNSGLGNIINPLLSLADDKVYAIPAIILIGWRGEPSVKDEPQHIRQGEVTEELLKALKIPYFILDSNGDFEKIISNSVYHAKNDKKPCVILVRKGTFSNYNSELNNKQSDFELSRERSIEIILDTIGTRDIIVSTTGKASREVFEHRRNMGQNHSQDFLTVGGMGHASSIAFGIATQLSNRIVYCLDGDGAFLMHMGSAALIGQSKLLNFKHIVLNNGSHESVGGQPTVALNIKIPEIAISLGYTFAEKVENEENLSDVLKLFSEHKGRAFLEVKVNNLSRKELIRPDVSPYNNKLEFQNFLRT